MAFYEFECDTCGFIKEVLFRTIPETIPTHLDKTCDECGGKTMKHIISAPNFHLKGNCWAKDGYTMQHMDGSRVTSVMEDTHPDYPKEAKGLK